MQKKNFEIDSLMEAAKSTVECQQAEFTALVDSAKVLFESQQKELGSIMDGLPLIQFK